MPSYSFDTLSPAEFENLSRDLLQVEFGVHIESFTSGRDGGIDLRCATTEDGKTIIQSKRHLTSAQRLITHLKNKEVSKVQKLKPARYVLTTSVGLTPANKDTILGLFEPYIKTTEDIYSKDDLNNLLGKHPDIEKQHYKLWLSSTNILERIFSTDIVNRTEFEKEDIVRTVSLYVENDSYNQALEVFSKNRFVIISGVPGIGKTTLARMMTSRLLADGEFEQFVYISRGVEEALKLYNPEKKQLFFFDDFLGRNYFEKGFDRNEENDLVRFIERVSSSKNKGLILTTREYILRQAQRQYTSLEAKLITDSNYVVDLEKYTKLIRAQILYNHLFAYDVPYSHLSKFLEDRTYEYIISHKNYTPRLIETVLKERPWEEIEPKDFPRKIKSYFDKPSKLWEDAYTNGISEDARKLLKILFTLKTPISLTHLHAAFDASHRDAPVRPDYHVFEKTIKELENTFIDVKSTYDLTSNRNLLFVDYKNPSILDFFLDYFRDARRNDLLFAIKYPVYIDQMIYRFVDGKGTNLAGQLVMTEEIASTIAHNLLAGYDKLPFCEEGARRHTFSTRSYYVGTYPQVIHRILRDMGFSTNSDVCKQLLDSYRVFNTSGSEGNIDSQVYLLELFTDHMTGVEIRQALHAIIPTIDSVSNYEWFLSHFYGTSLSDIFEAWQQENDTLLKERAIGVAIDELQDLDLDELENYQDTLDYYEESLGLETASIDDAYQDALYDAQHATPDDYGYDGLLRAGASEPVRSINENEEIESMFDSLRQR